MPSHEFLQGQSTVITLRYLRMAINVLVYLNEINLPGFPAL